MSPNINQRIATLERYAQESAKRMNLLLWKQLKMENAITISKKQKFDLEQQFRQLQITNNDLKETILKNKSVIMDFTAKTRKMVDIEHLMKSLIEKTEKVTDLESKVKQLTEERDQIADILTMDNMASKTEKVVDEIKSDIKRLGQETKMIPSIKREIQRLTKETENVKDIKYDVSRLKEESRKMPAIITEIQRLDTKVQVDDLKRRTNQIEMRQASEDAMNLRHSLSINNTGKISPSVTCVYLEKEGNLTKDQRINLDKCYRVIINGGMFDLDSCCIVPQCDGAFIILLHTVQKGDGIVDMRLNWEGG